MITACAALDRSWALPAAFCLFAFAGFAHAACEDAGGCRYEEDSLLFEAIQEASSRKEWSYTTRSCGYRPGDKGTSLDCLSAGKKDYGWMALCRYEDYGTKKSGGTITYRLFLEKTGKIDELLEKQKIELKTGCDNNQRLKFELCKEENAVSASCTSPVCLTECQSEDINRFCTEGGTVAGSHFAKQVMHFIQKHASGSYKDRNDMIKISVVTKDGNGEETTSELFSLPMRGAASQVKELENNIEIRRRQLRQKQEPEQEEEWW